MSGNLPRIVTASALTLSLAGGAAAAQGDHPVDKRPRITIYQFTYTVPASVAPGARVVVINKDSARHSVTSNDRLFRVIVKGHGRGTFVTPTDVGSYAFHCRYHGSMYGTLVVK